MVGNTCKSGVIPTSFPCSVHIKNSPISVKWLRIHSTHLCERGGSFLFQEGAYLRKSTRLCKKKYFITVNFFFKLYKLLKKFCTGKNPHTVYRYMRQVTNQARSDLGVGSMKQLGVFKLPSGWDASPSQGFPQH